jgi:hypothetical protein
MMRRAFVLVVFAACKTQQAGPPTPPPPPSTEAPRASAVPSESSDAAPPGTIGEAGGALDAEGVRITIPEGSVRTPHVYTVSRVTGAALSDWPRGTTVGFVFEPAGKRFRIPATIELPHSDGEGEVMCLPYAGERMVLPFDATPAGKPFRFHVAELPRRCAVYSPEHARALRENREKESAIVDANNRSHRWEVKGKICDPHELVRPNAGKDLREPAGVGGCPAGMAPIATRAGVCVDRWEAHVVEVLDDGTEHTWSPYFNPGALRIRAKSAPNAVPQGYVSQIQAGKACAEAGKRLCKDDEWVLACKGSKGTQFPYGNTEKRGTCNDHRDEHPAAQYLESHDLSVFTKLEHPCISQVPDSLLPGGSKTGCATPEKLFDMVGNLHEWTADPAGTFRGGYYVDTWLNGHGCDYVTTRHDAVYWDYSIGFRCCADRK